MTRVVLLRIASAATLVVLLAAGCGGGSGTPPKPASAKLPHALAQRWAGEADAVASAVQAHDGCGAKQLARTLAADVDANSSRIPARLRTDLMSAVTTLVGRISCVQPKPETKPKPKPPPHKKPPKDHGHHGHGPGGKGDGG